MMLLLLRAAMMLRDDQFQSQLGDLADIKGHKHTEKRNLHTRAHTRRQLIAGMVGSCSGFKELLHWRRCKKVFPRAS